MKERKKSYTPLIHKNQQRDYSKNHFTLDFEKELLCLCASPAATQKSVIALILQKKEFRRDGTERSLERLIIKVTTDAIVYEGVCSHLP